MNLAMRKMPVDRFGEAARVREESLALVARTVGRHRWVKEKTSRRREVFELALDHGAIRQAFDRAVVCQRVRNQCRRAALGRALLAGQCNLSRSRVALTRLRERFAVHGGSDCPGVVQ